MHNVHPLNAVMRMKKFIISLISAMSLLLVPFASVAAQTFPNFPMAIFGTVTINSVNAGTDTVVKIYNGSVAPANLIDSLTVGASGAYGGNTAQSEKLDIPSTATGTLVFTLTETNRVDPDADVETTVTTAQTTLATNVTGNCPATSALAYVSGAVCGYTIAVTATLPDKPTALTAVQQSATSILLSWTAGAGAASVKVSRSTDNAVFTEIATGQTGASYTSTGLTAYTQYYYKLKSTNAAGDSASFSATANDTTFIIVPTGVTATADTTTQITVTWTAVTGAVSYVVYRGGTQVASGVTSASYIDTGLTASTSYSYTIAAVNADGTTAQSSSASATTKTASGGSSGGSSSSISGTTSSITTTTVATPSPATTPSAPSPAVTGVAQAAPVASVMQAPVVKTDVGEIRLIKEPNDSKVYLLKDGKKVWIPNEKVFLASGFKWNQVQSVETSALKAETTTTKVIKSPIDKKVYEINSDGTKTWVPNESAFLAKGYKWSEVVVIPTLNVLAYAEKGSASAGGGKTVQINSPAYGFLNVRSDAGTSNAKIAEVKDGASYSVLEEKSGWYKVEYDGGKTGWVHGGYTKTVSAPVVAAPAAPSTPAKTTSGKSVTVNTPSLNMRSGAGAENTRIGGVSQGQQFIVIEEKNGWIKVNVNSTEGWISGDYVK